MCLRITACDLVDCNGFFIWIAERREIGSGWDMELGQVKDWSSRNTRVIFINCVAIDECIGGGGRKACYHAACLSSCPRSANFGPPVVLPVNNFGTRACYSGELGAH